MACDSTRLSRGNRNKRTRCGGTVKWRHRKAVDCLSIDSKFESEGVFVKQEANMDRHRRLHCFLHGDDVAGEITQHQVAHSSGHWSVLGRNDRAAKHTRKRVICSVFGRVIKHRTAAPGSS